MSKDRQKAIAPFRKAIALNKITFVTQMVPKSFPGYNKEVHPPYDSVIFAQGLRYRLIQRCQTSPVWDISIPGHYLGQIEWRKDSDRWAVVNVSRQSVASPKTYPSLEDALMGLSRAVFPTVAKFVSLSGARVAPERKYVGVTPQRRATVARVGSAVATID